MLYLAFAASCLAMSTNQKPSRSSCWCRRTISRKRRRTRLRSTAPPSRRDVMNPARHGPQFSTGRILNVRCLPRCVTPSRFRRSYCVGCVRRRAFGNENESRGGISIGSVPMTQRLISRPRLLAIVASYARLGYKRNLPPKARRKTSQEKTAAAYYPGD